jgi:hypothetical protein
VVFGRPFLGSSKSAVPVEFSTISGQSLGLSASRLFLWNSQPFLVNPAGLGEGVGRLC